MFLWKIEITHGNMFETDFVIRWKFLKEGNGFLQFEKTHFKPFAILNN